MPTIPRVKQVWVDNTAGGTPISAARFNNMEDGIFDAQYQPAVRVFHNASQSLTSGVATALAFNSERFDQASNAADTMHDNVTQNSRLTCRYAGIYDIKGNVSFAGNATGYRLVQIRLGGATIIAETLNPVNSAAASTDMLIACHYQLAVNDYVELVCTQNSGGALNVAVGANYSPEFSMVRVA